MMGLIAVPAAASGSGWSIQHTPNPTGARNSFVSGVACSSATACTAVGNYTDSTFTGLTLAEHWNGTGWAIQPSPNPSGSQSSALSAVACTTATACTAVGYYTNSAGTQVTLGERWNGETWAIQHTRNPSGAHGSVLSGVACTAAATCTAVGSYTNSAGAGLTLAERWNGSSWVIQPTPNPAGARNIVLSGVACTSANVCTAVGNYTNSGFKQVTLAEHWAGTAWAIQPTPNPSGANGSVLTGVACGTATLCHAVGHYLNSSGVLVTLAERSNLATWAIQPTANPSGAQSSVLLGVACTTTSACATVGNSTNSAGSGVTLAERWNGVRWAIQPTPNPKGAQRSSLSAVACTDPIACTAVGNQANSAGIFSTLAERHS